MILSENELKTTLPSEAPDVPSTPEANTSTNDEAYAKARAANAQAFQESREAIWFLKDIHFNGEPRKVITQNYNGPCSLIAICNILILRGDIEILPHDRTSVSYELLSQLVGEFLLRASPDVDLSAALSIMPRTQKGMDLNPLFTSPTAFRPAGDGGALKLFEQARIQLVHGWLVDPDSPEHLVVARSQDYDSAVNLIVEADTLAKGQLVVEDSVAGPSSSVAGPSNAHFSDQWSAEDRRKVEDALVLRKFLESTSSQLTYHGLFTLASTLEPGAPVALFRGSHLSVLYKPAIEDAALYSLVTDAVFFNEPSVVWERVEDVDGGSSTFVDAEFRQSNPAGGDFAGETAERIARYADIAAAQYDPADQALAQQLQAEEDARAHEIYAQRARERGQDGRLPPEQYQQPPPEWYAQQQQLQGLQPYDPRDPRRQQQLPPGMQHSQSQGNYYPTEMDFEGPREAPTKLKRNKSCLIM